MKKEITVLLIEDSPEDRMNIKRKVLKLNELSQVVHLNYVEAGNLQDGFHEITKNEIDVILLDLSLPDADGIESIERLNKKHSIPIVILTGNEDEESSLETIKAGAQDYLIKREISPHVLSKAILFAVKRYKLAQELEELRIQQAQSMKMATLGEMAGGLAHEINNPLMIILGYADRLIKVAKEDKSNNDYEEYAMRIREVTQRVAKIIRGLKSYSRNDTEDPLEDTTFSQILSNTLSLCSAKFKSQGVDLYIDNITDANLSCKDVQISQVILNLLNNACDAIMDKDEKWIRIHSEVESDYLEVYISDSGYIKDESIRSSLFKPFYTTKERGKGTGLGMSISKNIIDNHNGSIELLDNSKNTIFKIRLPIESNAIKNAG